MEIKQFLYLICAFAVILIMLLIADHFSPNRVKGRNAENITRKSIKKVFRKKPVKVLNNVYLPLYKGTSEIDHLVFGTFGVLVVETKGISGTVSGRGKQLEHKMGNQKYKFYNPQEQNKTHINNVVHHLKKGGYKNVSVTGSVVFTDPNIQLNAPVGMTVAEFEKFCKGLKNCGANPDILYDYFKSIQVRSPLRKFMHRFEVKKNRK